MDVGVDDNPEVDFPVDHPSDSTMPANEVTNTTEPDTLKIINQNLETRKLIDGVSGQEGVYGDNIAYYFFFNVYFFIFNPIHFLTFTFRNR